MIYEQIGFLIALGFLWDGICDISDNISTGNQKIKETNLDVKSKTLHWISTKFLLPTIILRVRQRLPFLFFNKTSVLPWSAEKNL